MGLRGWSGGVRGALDGELVGVSTGRGGGGRCGVFLGLQERSVEGSERLRTLFVGECWSLVWRCRPNGCMTDAAQGGREGRSLSNESAASCAGRWWMKLVRSWCVRRCSSSIPSSSSRRHCPSCHPHSCPYPPLSQGCWAPDFRPSRPLRPCLLSTSRTFPSNVHIPCRALLSDDSCHLGQGVSATRSASRKICYHSACNDAVARKARKISGRQARRRFSHGRLVSNGRAWVDL